MFQFIEDLLRPTESQVDKELKARELKGREASKLAEFTERNGTEGAFAHVLRRRLEVSACDDIVHGWMDDDWTTARVSGFLLHFCFSPYTQQMQSAREHG